MSADFSFGWRSWRAVLFHRKWTVLFLAIISILLVYLYIVVSLESRVLSSQISQLTGQVEVIAEIDPGLGSEQVKNLEREISSLPMVKKVDFWSSERSAQYIDQHVLKGYLDFVNKTSLDVPVNPLFRIQLAELGQKEELEGLLMERFGTQIFVADSSIQAEGESFAKGFLHEVSQAALFFQVTKWVVLSLLIGVMSYFVFFLVSERRMGVRG